VRFYKGFRFRVYPTRLQEMRLIAWENALRFLWNLALDQRHIGLSRPRDERRFPTAFDQINELTELRSELSWLSDVPHCASTQLLIELDKAWQRCFNKLASEPQWKRKGIDLPSVCASGPKRWRFDGENIRFPKLGNLRAVIHRPLEGKPKTCTLKRDGDQWFASIVCEIDFPEPITRTEPVVAIDRGVTNIIGDSDGRLIQSPRFYEAAQRRLARAQRSVSRKKKGSKNRDKAKVRVMRLHRKVRRQREHFLHGLSHDYAKNHGVVVIEKLRITSMVKMNRGLARGILDAGWSRFAAMLRYKLAWSGGSLVEVPAAYSSQTCSACGHVDAESRCSQNVFRCTACGYIDHADLNAAKVLKSRANRSGLLGEGTVPEAALRTKKRLRVVKSAPSKSSPLEAKVITAADRCIL